MRAYKCDGCGEYQNGGPILVVEMTIQTPADQDQYDFCAWSCVGKYVEKRLSHSKRLGL